MTQAATIKERLSDELGKSGAFPAPALLAQLSAPQPGLTDRKIGQLRALGTAAQDGALTRERLRAMTHEDALEHLQQLPGIGPFSAELILIRGAGNPDALPDHDTRLDDAIRSAYNTSDDSVIDQITESWRPYRAWVALLLRAWREAETGEIRYAVLAESVGAGGQIGVEPSSLFGVEGGEHPLLHGGDGGGGADEALGAGVGEGEVFVAAGAIALDKVGASQRA